MPSAPRTPGNPLYRFSLRRPLLNLPRVCLLGIFLALTGTAWQMGPGQSGRGQSESEQPAQRSRGLSAVGDSMAPAAAFAPPAPGQRSAPHSDGVMAAHVPRSAAFEGMLQASDYRRLVASRAGRPENAAELAQLATSPMLPDWLAGAETDSLQQSASDSPVYLPLGFARSGKEALAPVIILPPATPVPEPTELPEPAPSAEPSPQPSPAPAITYWRDAMPILRAECATCHYAGGIGPFALESYAQSAAQADLIKWALEEGIMPPLPADPNRGAPFDDPRILSPADRQTLIAWVEAGAPEGDPADAPDLPPPPEDPWGEPDLRLDIGADYAPPADQLDDYRCFVIDPKFRRDTEIAMVDLVPTANEMFHHGILFLAEPDMVATARQLDAAEAGPGYSCFGGPGFNSPDWVAMEAVGSPTLPYPAGTAKVIEAGSQFVLQLHYNTLNGQHRDRSEVRIWLPERPVGRAPRDYQIFNFLFALPPGQRENQAESDLRIAARDSGGRLGQSAQRGWLWRVWGHMHMLGTGFRLDLVRADGSQERVLDIPRWNFNWQGSYDLIDPIKLEAGDRIHMTCRWDNSAENQPWRDGKQIAPRRVTWGEGTFDEMCLGGVTITD